MADALSDTLRGILGGTLVVFVGNVIGMGSSFVTRVIAARHLAPGDYGLIVLGVTLLNIGTMVVLLGLHQGIAKRLPNTESPGALVLMATGLAMPLAIVAASLVLALSRPISNVFSTQAFEPVLSVFAVALPMMVLVELLVGGFRGLELAIYRVVTKDVLFKGALVIAIAVGAAFGGGTVDIALAWPLSLLFAIAGGSYLMTRRSGMFRRGSSSLSGNMDVQAIHSLAVFSLPLMISETTWLMMQQVDNVILGIFLLPADIGVYDAAYSIATSLSLIPSTFSFLFLPAFSKFAARNEIGKMDRFYKIVTKWMTFLLVPPFILFVLYPREIITFVYGEAYSAGSVALAIVVLGFFVTTVAGNSKQSIIALGKSRLVLFGNVVALAVNVSMNIALIPRFGIIGAAVATFLSYGTINLLFGYFLYTRTGIHPFSAAIVRPMLVAGTVFLLSAWLLKLHIHPGPLAIALSVALGVLYVGLFLLSGAVESEEVDMVLAIGDDAGINVERAIDMIRRYS